MKKLSENEKARNMYENCAQLSSNTRKGHHSDVYNTTLSTKTHEKHNRR